MPDGVQVLVSPTPTSVVVRVSGQQTVRVESHPQTVTVRTQGRGPEGPRGPVGPAGIVIVEHGTNANMARPDSPVVYWVGSAAPLNAEPYDLWYLT
jgi:hypothetical protein